MKSIIITGSTGMVGKSILLEALEDDRISGVLLINRSSAGMTHPKLKELLVSNYEDLPLHTDAFKDYDTCFHCMGVSSVGMNEKDYSYVTYDLTKILADTLYEANPTMSMSYVSGVGTDSSEKGSTMWARVKGKTENMILHRGFSDAYMIRLGGILPEKGIKSRTGWYNAIYVVTRPLFPLMKQSKGIVTTTNFGKAMLNTLFFPQEKKILDNKDLNKLARLNGSS
jgi:hypothetical protein